MLARFVDQHMSARYQEKSCVALEEESTCIGQRLLLLEGQDSCSSEQERFDHRRAGAELGGIRPQFGPSSGVPTVRYSSRTWLAVRYVERMFSSGVTGTKIHW